MSDTPALPPMNLTDLLRLRFQQAIARAFGDDHVQVDPLISAATNPKFGDFQVNAAMSLAKSVRQKPRDVAQAIIEAAELDDLCQQVDLAGPGFINLTLHGATLGQAVWRQINDPRLGVVCTSQPETVVVDYSSPNVAKAMHVGHLRSTIIGDTIARLLEHRGDAVIRQNHLGDWGTQFGMLIEHLLDQSPELQSGQDRQPHIEDLESFYQQARQRFDTETDFAARARQRVVQLQGGDPQTLSHWNFLVAESARHFQAVYQDLGVTLTDQHIRGESAYNEQLASIVAELESSGHLRVDQGAKVVYPSGFKDRDGNPLGLIVQKSDGGYLYATTDLAAARYRIEQLQAERIIYVTDARQAQHFAMVFATLRETGWASQRIKLEHVPFGMVLGPDRKPFQTRSGGTVKLIDLMHEATRRAQQVLAEKAPQLDDAQRKAVADVLGVGALKYADLSGDRIKDYVFDYDRMLSFDGNTAPYLINAYVRIRSIFRTGVQRSVIDRDPLADRQALGDWLGDLADSGAWGAGRSGQAGSQSEASPQASAEAPATDMKCPVHVQEPAERALVLKLISFAEVVEAVAQTLEPHRLCTYLYELASQYHRFYEQCPVLKAGSLDLVVSRLVLGATVALVLEQGLALLGIGTVDRM